jgi:hypothetical protein
VQGARVVQQSVLEPLEAFDDVKVHIIWTPVLAKDSYAAAVAVRDLIPDPRATHYWDADRSLGLSYTKSVMLPEDNNELAWDVYFIYEQGTRWRGSPPVPADWWHQLADDQRFLADGKALGKGLLELARKDAE